MSESEIIFRPAMIGDIDRIWDLLHANSISWDEAHILGQLRQLFILFKDHDILGVVCTHENEPIVNWIAIHPLYPEEKLKELMTELLKNLYTHDVYYLKSPLPTLL